MQNKKLVLFFIAFIVILTLCSCNGRVSIIGEWLEDDGSTLEFLKDDTGVWGGINFDYELINQDSTIHLSNILITRDYEILKLSETELILKDGSELHQFKRVEDKTKDTDTTNDKVNSSALSGAWKMDNYALVEFFKEGTGTWDGTAFEFEIKDRGKTIRIVNAIITKDYEILQFDSDELIIKCDDEIHVMSRMEDSPTPTTGSEATIQPTEVVTTATALPTTIPVPESVEMSLGEVKQFGNKLVFIRQLMRVNRKCEFSSTADASSEYYPILEVIILKVQDGTPTSIENFKYIDAFESVSNADTQHGVNGDWSDRMKCVPPVGDFDAVFGHNYDIRSQKNYPSSYHFYLEPHSEREWKDLRGFGLQFTVTYENDEETKVFVNLEQNSVSYQMPERFNVIDKVLELYNKPSENIKVNLVSFSAEYKLDYLDRQQNDVYTFLVKTNIENIGDAPYIVPSNFYIIDQYATTYDGKFNEEVKLFPGENIDIIGSFDIQADRDVSSFVILFDKPYYNEASIIKIDYSQIESAIKNLQSGGNISQNISVTPTFDPLIGPGIPEYENVDTCASLYETELSIGITGMVALGGLPNRIRSDSNTLAPVLGQINPGELYTVLAGPLCVNGSRWWQIDPHQDNIPTGWTVEGDATTKWLVPCDQNGVCQ